MKVFFATFGQAHKHKDKYIKIYCDSEGQAQEFMMRKYGTDWSMLYDSDDFNKDLFSGGLLSSYILQQSTLRPLKL